MTCTRESSSSSGLRVHDGALFVKLSMAMDAIAKDLVESRKNTALAYLCTPTDCHISTPAASAVASRNYRSAPRGSVLALLGTGLRRNGFRKAQSDDGSVYPAWTPLCRSRAPTTSWPEAPALEGDRDEGQG